MSVHPRPSVGRIVRYVSHGTPVRSDGSQQFPPEAQLGGSWHWPEHD